MKNKFIFTASSLTLASLFVFGQVADAQAIKVKKGDTLYSLSKKYELSLNDFMKHNKLTNTNIYIGQTLSVPDGKTTVPNPITKNTTKQVSTKGDSLNIRTGGAVTYKVVGKLKDKSIVTVISEKNDWSYIQYSGLKGYVKSSYLINVASTPNPTVPVTPPKQPVNNIPVKTYTVKSGDTLYRVGVNLGVSYQNIKKWSNLSSDTLKVGQVLIVSDPSNKTDKPIVEAPKPPTNPSTPSTQSYTVKKGDYLSKIANEFGLSLNTLMSLNKLTSTVIHPGDKLIVSSNSNSPFLNPVEGVLTSMYGYRTHPITGEYKLHRGIDIKKAGIVPIVAAYDGKVIRSRNDVTGWGNYVTIEHTVNGKLYATVYAHLSKRDVNVGDTVKKGQQIGLMGNTGMSTGQHLHLELFEGVYPNKAIDPLLFFY